MKLRPSLLPANSQVYTPWYRTGLRLGCLYAVFVSLFNNSASSQASFHKEVCMECGERGYILEAPVLHLIFSSFSPPPLPLRVQSSNLLCRTFWLFQISNSKIIHKTLPGIQESILRPIVLRWVINIKILLQLQQFHDQNLPKEMTKYSFQ